jgi:hypothetical protein
MTIVRNIRKVRAAGQKRKKAEMEDRTIVLFGDSHSYAVQRAIEKRKGKNKPVSVAAHRLLKIKNGKQQGDTSLEEFLEKVRTLGPEDVVLSMIGGNQHAVYSTIQHPRPFDFLEPGGGPTVAEGVELIPYRALSEFFRTGISKGDWKSLEALRNATPARVVHIIPPPPKGDNEFIQRYHESLFAREGIASHGVSSPALRMKFWKLQTRVLEELCKELDIEVMMPPAATLDGDGFLDKRFFADDATHGNPMYGELVLREIESRYGSEAVTGQVQS